MQNPNDDRQALAGLVHCGTCRDPMIRMGPNYACPNGIINQGSGCQNSTIDAHELLRAVADQIIKAVMRGPNLRAVKDYVQEEARMTTARLRANLEQTERALAALNRREADLLTRLEGAGEDTSAVLDELNDVVDKKTALTYEARSSRREIDVQGFISDEDRIAANASDVDTYVDDALPEQTIEFVHNFVESVHVSSHYIYLVHRFPMPSRANRQGDFGILVPRTDRNQTGGARDGTS